MFPCFFSFKDILENEDVKLDNMFIASMVADIIRVSHIICCCNLHPLLMSVNAGASYNCCWLHYLHVVSVVRFLCFCSSPVSPSLSLLSGCHLFTWIAHTFSWLFVHFQFVDWLTLGGQIEWLWFVCFQERYRRQLHRCRSNGSQMHK